MEYIRCHKHKTNNEFTYLIIIIHFAHDYKLYYFIYILPKKFVQKLLLTHILIFQNFSILIWNKFVTPTDYMAIYLDGLFQVRLLWPFTNNVSTRNCLFTDVVNSNSERPRKRAFEFHSAGWAMINSGRRQWRFKPILDIGPRRGAFVIKSNIGVFHVKIPKYLCAAKTSIKI